MATASKAGMSLFITAEPGAQDKPRPKAKKNPPKPKMSGAKKAPLGMANAGSAMFNAPSTYKEPSPAEKTKSDMDYSKRNATRRWVDGEMSNAKHAQVHARANKVLKGMKMGR